MIAAKHPREPERLAALRLYEVLDTDPEVEFDDIATLTARLCGTPIAVVNLIDGERQFFKAEVGLGVRETPLPTSLCSHAILEHEFVEIHDTLQDPRMIDNPLCYGEPGLRFYAGALLTTAAGLPIGTLCVLDYEPRALSPVQRDAMKVLARQVMAQLDLRHSLANAETLRQEVDHRVKNSLQSLSAFVGIKARSTTSPEARDVLESVTQNIRTVSMLHELLYKTEAGSSVDLGRFIGNVVDFLSGVAPAGIDVTCETTPVSVTSRQAAGVGTLLNELAANAFKYAFPDGRTGRVHFSLSRPDPGVVTLVCTDDGIGPPEGYEVGTGLGMKLIAAVTAQLRGTVRHGAGEPGMRLELIFPLLPEEEKPQGSVFAS